MDSRAFREGDLRLLLELCQERWPNVRHTFGNLAFWSLQLAYDNWQARLWFDDGRLAGWGWTSGGLLEFEGPDELVGEIVEWAATDDVFARPADAALLEPLGYRLASDTPWFRVNQRALDELAEASLPDGYRLTTMADHDDFASRAAAQRAAFAPGSRFTEAAYAVVRASWPYRADLDCVCVAPGGEVASYALAWLDERNRLGELEPVGTLPDHRRLGLARATNLFALHRLREAGAETALVGSRGDEAYPIPTLLYESIGFREVARAVRFTRLGATAGV